MPTKIKRLERIDSICFDKTPSFENKCWNYTCNEKNGNCERTNSGAACPKLPDLCHEYVCDSKLKCSYQKKTCVKTSPYIEMDCYKAECNFCILYICFSL